MNQRTGSKQPHNRWWIVIGALLGLTVGNGPIMQFTFGVFLLPVTREFGWARSQASLALAIGLAATALCVPIAGRLMDRYGVRRVSLPAITAFAAATAALAFVPPSPLAFALLYALMGAAAAGQSPLPYAKAIAAAFDQSRGLALGIAMAGVGIGTAVVPQLAQYVVAHYGWKQAYLTLGGLTFVLGITAMGWLIHEPHGATARRIDRADIPGLAIGAAVRTPQFWKLSLAFFVVAAATNGAIAHLVPLLGGRGIAPAVATSALAGAGLALTLGRLFAGWLLDRFFAPYVAIFFFLLPLAGLVLLIAGSGLGMSIAAVVLIGLGLGAEVDLIAFLLSRYFGMRSFGEIYGYLFTLFMLGNGLGPWVMGVSFDATGSYTLCLAVMCGALAVAALLVSRLGAYGYPPERDTGTSSACRTAAAH
ncbi:MULTISPECIES: MFS transporter [Burkholderia cepacia complex]|uniref:MFS transporter n=1 Tax=Burkholderia cepacia complex TaxID=87882 RepID=UPI000052ED65|nr:MULTISPECIES: MFS transporter [Burkholderia cepacia complex]ABK06934.1 major facilitator superfamily MFS_1 [Burkholderia cenocepacia HI2424]MBJ9727710.1 MFS transporter [Burkholderia cenocepacia]MCA8334064.1 MFS transporter [Burkholderia cepacia]MDN7914168.1 MFS transporter [Burkholderia cepacia]MDR5663681.1 MFS transporter [Burkholderia cenocepacia]